MNGILQDRVAIVTGAGRGLGRAHALALAREGARVVVNDFGADSAGSPAHQVVDEILRAGGEAMVDGGDVTRFDQMETMADAARRRWGRIDILVNNAGILRDKSFAKMALDDFRAVLDVHVMGAVHATKAVWADMCARKYGRIVMTTSSSGLYGNFGQSNYGAAKMALVGLMQTLAIEGDKHGIRVNCLAPSAATAMTHAIMPPEALAQLQPERVSPGVVALVAEDAPTRAVLLAGAGSFECAHITMTQGIHVDDEHDAARQVRQRFAQIADRTDESVPASGFEQFKLEIAKRAAVTRV